ncbi:MAG: hypothetical protein IT361_10150 [Gemmatimonadaceae bacterium]|nr:hypothetical protein [Gemmatimonadaceae bacterium]
MYTTCTFCYGPLGTNTVLETFRIARRVAFDPGRGCLWAVCPLCARWNLAPIEERWETLDECERRFRATSLRYSSGNVGLAWLQGDLDLIRIGPALRPEVAAWRYGRMLTRRRPRDARALGGMAGLAVRGLRRLLAATGPHRTGARRALADVVLGVYGHRVADVVHLPAANAPSTDLPVAIIRLRHLVGASLMRPEPGRPWSLAVPHDQGVLTLEGEAGVRTVARMLAVINGTERGRGFSHDLLTAAVAKVEESARPDSYFNRVLTIALRSSWGREDADVSPVTNVEMLELATSETERLAWRLTGRTFWGRGGIGSDPATTLLDVPLVDRVALEIAAHEESERRAMEGELADLAQAWREADEIATIADALLGT